MVPDAKKKVSMTKKGPTKTTITSTATATSTKKPFAAGNKPNVGTRKQSVAVASDENVEPKGHAAYAKTFQTKNRYGKTDTILQCQT